MDKAKFTSATGDLVQIDRADHPLRKDWAFIPNELPATFEFSSHLWPLLADARERLGTLNGIGQTLDDPELLLQPLRNRESITSNRIEGTFVTAENLLLFEMDPKEPKSARDESASWYEVFNYNLAMKTACEMMASQQLNCHMIRAVHSILMRGVRGQDKSPGEFRKKQVQIGSNARFVAPPSHEIERLMGNLQDYITDEDSTVDPLVKCFVVHYQFETIHPFEDGNGRMGRLLLALMIYKSLGHKMPWLYLSAFFDKYQDEYFANLFDVSATGQWNKWIEFCLRATLSQANDSIIRCDKFKALKQKYHDQLPSAVPRCHMIVDWLFRNPIVRTVSVKSHLDVHYKTAQSDIDTLVEAGILRELRFRRPKTYFAPDIMSIAYDPDGSC